MFKNFEPLNSHVHQENTDESYTIVLNYILAGGTVQQATFNFDWSILPDRNYIVHYSYNTANMSLTTGKVCLISSDIFSTSNTYIASAVGGRTTAQSSTILGVAYPYIYGATSALHADDSTAPPLYLNTRPTQNQFTVSIKTADATPVDYPSLGAWVLILRFTPVDRSGRSFI
jgi:hypothetical protein